MAETEAPGGTVGLGARRPEADGYRRRGDVRSALEWITTAAGTATSALALDAFAAVGGLLLVATGVLDGAPSRVVVAVLLTTYVAWFAGLRTNLVANWRLLEESGTCTNLPSKVLFEVAASRSAGPRVRLAVSAIGYVATEIVKEAPYYAGAFGIAGSSDGVDSTDALVFLAGTNLAAGLYEYGLARLSRVYLGRRSARRFARSAA